MTIHVTEDRSVGASSGSIAQKVVYALLEIAFLLSPRNPSTIGHRDLVGVGDHDFPVSCVLIARCTVPCDVVSSAEVASTESRLTILCFDNCPHTGLLCGGLLGFYHDGTGGLGWYRRSRYAWQAKYSSIIYF
jgi:hypothetical protein